jgi:3-deoxy-manno-octulosonate cytidylyltransferase (CMP-KDO synthetase)
MTSQGKQDTVLGVIPARLGSTRLPHKVLREVAGRPLVEWVYRAASSCAAFRRVVVATDSDEVLSVCRERGIEAMLTSPLCASGSDRVFEVAGKIPADIYVNIQGDEPLLTAAHFAALLAPFKLPDVGVTTLSVPCPVGNLTNPNVVKVVTALDGRALYFSRAAIPHLRNGANQSPLWRKHLGIYAYRRSALAAFAMLSPSPLEEAEKLEQLRLLENNIPIWIAEAPADTVGVDTEEDLIAVEKILLARG